MGQENLAKEVLAMLNNAHTLVKEKDSIKANYYNFSTDTIYLTTNFNENKLSKGLEDANPFCGNLVTICHECIHSIQSKVLHILNFILANTSVVLMLIALGLMALTVKPIWFCIVSVCVVMLSITCRLWLEIDAIYKSIDLAEKVLNKVNVRGVDATDIKEAKKLINKLMPVQLVRMVLDKIMMLAVVVI